MSEAPAPPIDTMADPQAPKPFSVDMEVNGLPYVLRGELPDQPGDFELVVGLPDATWQQLEPEIEKLKSENGWYASRYRDLQTALHLGDGKVGSVWVSAGKSPDGSAEIHINRIQTEPGYLPEDSEYYKAKGVGSAILDNLCAFADTKGWRISLTPSSRDGRIDDYDLQEWYRRRGFKYKFEEEDQELKRLYGPGAEMLRFPQQPDDSQPILAAQYKQNP